MAPSPEQILTVAQMQAAEQRIIDSGSSVEALMELAGRGAAHLVWRMAGRHKVTVLCGPGNNGGDGYVIGETLRNLRAHVVVVAPVEPKTPAAQNARALYNGEVLRNWADVHGEVMVDCLFGSGLTRALTEEHADLLDRLARSHSHRVAVDVPSGVQSDSGLLLSDKLPAYDLTIALGAWKFAHFLMPAAALMGRRHLVDIGVSALDGAAIRSTKPDLAPPPANAHKYRRGLLAVVAGSMPGAAILACEAAQRAGAGYVKLFTESAANAPADLVIDSGRLSDVLTDHRNSAILIGPGLGRDSRARERLVIALADPVPAVLDADALVLLGERQLAERTAATIATPHEGELVALERTFGLDGSGSKPERASALARESGMVIVAKGPDTVIAAPDGRLVCAERSTSWLSTAGTGDVLAGIIASRIPTGADAFTAACEGVWLHGEAARHCQPPFTAGELAKAIPAAVAACL